MIEPTGRTFICSVTFIDIVRYSEASIAQQMAMKARLNRAIAQAVDAVAESERIILDTGDGAAICFLGDPEDALFAATAINRSAGDPADGPRLLMRIGLNLGPIKLVVDLNGRTNVVGDGINVAQRIMSFADEGEILVSRSYYEVVARLTEGNERLFQYLGVRRDKHIREHQLYAFSMHGEAPRETGEAFPALELAVAPGAAPSPTAPDDAGPAPAGAPALAPDVLQDEERRLARHIGPLARIMVGRLAPTAATVGELRRGLAELITDPADRSAYLAAPGLDQAPELEATAAAPAATPRRDDLPLALDDDERAAIEHQLAHAIGPLARILVRKALAGAADRAALYEALAGHIRSEGDRAAFLAAVRRLG